MRRCHGAFFAPGLSKWISSRDTHICLCNGVSYPCPRALVTYIARQECEKRKGGYRENGAGEYRDPLHLAEARVWVGGDRSSRFA
jgi:hypothetical protein